MELRIEKCSLGSLRLRIMSNFIDIINLGDLMRNVCVTQMTLIAALSAALCVMVTGANTVLTVMCQAFTWSGSVA